MMKKLLIAGSVLMLSIANAQDQPQLQTGSLTRNFKPNPVATLVSGVTDSLNYFYNKNFFLNTQATQNSFWTIKQAINSISSHHGSMYMNTSTLQVTGLEGLVMRGPNSTNTMVPVKLYLCNVSNVTNLPVFPPLDSVITGVSNSNGGVFVGGTFTAPVTVTGKFAVLFRNGSTNSGDTVNLFMNNAAAPTSTSPANQKFGENLGVRRTNGNFASNTNYYGSGRDWEFVVSAWITFDLDAEIAVNTPTICTNSSGSFSNMSTPQGMLDHRQFNFNRFYQKWAPLALAAPSNTQIVLTKPDSTYIWEFTGATTNSTNVKHPSVVFNSTGPQTASLTVNYKQQANLGTNPSITDITTETISVTNSAAPVIAIAGPTAICAGMQATLTASGNTTYTWTTPSSQSSSVVVSPVVTTVYSVSGSNLGCIGSQTLNLIVNTAPTVAVSTPTAACAGALFTITASGAHSYSWNNGSTTFSNSVSAPAGPVASFTVTGSKDGCPTSVVVANVPINEKPEVMLFADVTTVCSKAQGGLPVVLTGDPVGGIYSGVGVSNGKFTPNNTGTFVATYSYTDAATGCANKATQAMIVSACAGLADGQFNSNVTIYPNPAVNGKVTVANLEGSNVITVYNILGSIVSKEAVNYSEYSLDLSSQSEGTYFMRVTNSSGDVKTVKIVNHK